VAVATCDLRSPPGSATCGERSRAGEVAGRTGNPRSSTGDR
jgi:hypothetical protein